MPKASERLNIQRMAEKKRGRPRSDTTMVALYTRVPVEEAEAFEELVRRRSMAATGKPDALSTSAVLRGLMAAAVEAEGVKIVTHVDLTTKPEPKPRRGAK